MDFLTVAAAAGAGYVAKYLHRISKENDVQPNPDSTSAVVQGRQETARDGSYTGLRRNEGQKINIGAESTVREGLEDFGRYEDCNLLSLAGLPPVLDEKEIFQLGSGNIQQYEVGESSRGPLPDSVAEEVVFTHHFPRGGRSIRSRRPWYSNFAKSLNSLESCLTAQLYEQHLAIENFMTGPHSSPSLRTRPLLITDGKRVISRARSDFQADTRLHTNRIEDKLHFGSPRLPKRSLETNRRPTVFQRRVKPNNGGQWSKKVNVPTATENVGLSDSRGLHNGMHLFLIGVTIGILSTAFANKREIDKLNELLKQSKNLVQDLEDEIEMKQSITMKEVVCEKVGIQESDGNTLDLEYPTTSMGKLVDSEKNCSKENDQTAKQYESDGNTLDLEYPTTGMGKLVDSEKNCSKENDQTAKQYEIMSQIEAELEAELERLELNLKGSTLEKIADLVELDPDYEADVAKGEFRLENMTKIQNEESDEDNHGSTSSGHTDYANRPVSPRELSLRLHEVIEAQLESRIMELETALQDSQKRVCSLEISVSKAKACSEKGTATASPQGVSSPDDQNSFDQPLVINLAGDALDAYNEAYEEIFRMVKTEDETPPDTIYNNNQAQTKTISSQSPYPTNMRGLEEQPSENIESNDDSDDDDLLGKLLIQQIVEKTRQGSPLVLNAQRMLYSMDEQQTYFH